MKKILCCVCVLIVALYSFCQDIIVTNDAQEIEAKILEVSKSEIKYKEKDYLNGPTFILDVNEVHSIIYANGKVVLYNQTSEIKPAPKEESTSNPISSESPQQKEPNSSVAENYNVEILLLSGQTIKGMLMELAANYVAFTYNGKYFSMPASQVDKVTDLRNRQVTIYGGKEREKKENKTSNVPIKYLSRKGNSYYYDGKQMRGKDYEYFLSIKCSSSYNQYKKGHNIAIAGWVLFGIGVGLDVGFSWWVPYTAIPALGFEIACIPTLAVGYSKMHKTVDTFNTSCAKRNTTYWSINASENGIGLAWNF